MFIFTIIMFGVVSNAFNEWHENECYGLGDDPEEFNSFKRSLHDTTLFMFTDYYGFWKVMQTTDEAEVDTVIGHNAAYVDDMEETISEANTDINASWYPEAYQDWAELPNVGGGIHPMDNPNCW